MRLTFLNTLYPPYGAAGAETTLRLLATQMRDRGHDCNVVTLTPGWRAEAREIDGIPVYYVPLANVFWPHGASRTLPWRVAFQAIEAYNPVMKRRLARLLRRLSPDVVNFHQSPGLLGLRVGGGAGFAHSHRANTARLLHGLPAQRHVAARTRQLRVALRGVPGVQPAAPGHVGAAGHSDLRQQPGVRPPHASRRVPPRGGRAAAHPHHPRQQRGGRAARCRGARPCCAAPRHAAPSGLHGAARPVQGPGEPDRRGPTLAGRRRPPSASPGRGSPATRRRCTRWRRGWRPSASSAT